MRGMLSLFVAMLGAASALVVMPTAPRLSPAVAGRACSLSMADGVPVAGKCKWFNVEKGYGFIALDDEEKDVFVHQSDIYAPGFRSLKEGEPLGARVQSPPSHIAFCCRTSSSAFPVCRFVSRRVPPDHGREDRQSKGRGRHWPGWRLRERSPRRARKLARVHPYSVLCLAAHCLPSTTRAHTLSVLSTTRQLIPPPPFLSFRCKARPRRRTTTTTEQKPRVGDRDDELSPNRLCAYAWRCSCEALPNAERRAT